MHWSYWVPDKRRCPPPLHSLPSPISTPSLCPWTLVGVLAGWGYGLQAVVCHSRSAATDCDCGRWARAHQLLGPSRPKHFFFSFPLWPSLSWSRPLPRLSLSVPCQCFLFVFGRFFKSSVLVYPECSFSLPQTRCLSDLLRAEPHHPYLTSIHCNVWNNSSAMPWYFLCQLILFWRKQPTTG